MYQLCPVQDAFQSSTMQVVGDCARRDSPEKTEEHILKKVF